MKNIYFLLFTIYMFSSCNNKNEKNPIHVISKDIKPTEISIDMNDKSALPFDSLMELTSVVKLQTTRDNLIGKVSQILFTNDRIIVVDREISKSISVYDMFGKFLNKIGSLGQAPNEYAFLWQVSFMPDKSTLFIADMGSNKIKLFNINGDFINAIKSPYWFESCEFIDNEKIAINSPTGIKAPLKKTYLPQLLTTSLDGDIYFHNFPSKETKIFHFSTAYPLRKFNNTILYNPSYTDSIFKITTDGILPYYYLNIKRKKPFVITNETSSKDFSEELKNTPAYFGGDYVELQNYAVFDISEPNMNWRRFVTYSKKQNKSFYCNGNYHDTRLRFFIQPKFLYKDDILVTYISPEEVLMYKKELYRLCKKEDIDKLLENLTEDDNPVLFFYRIKI